MKELIKPNHLLGNTKLLEFHCEVFDCSGCQSAICNKVCSFNPNGNASIKEDEEILF